MKGGPLFDIENNVTFLTFWAFLKAQNKLSKYFWWLFRTVTRRMPRRLPTTAVHMESVRPEHVYMVLELAFRDQAGPNHQTAHPENAILRTEFSGIHHSVYIKICTVVDWQFLVEPKFCKIVEAWRNKNSNYWTPSTDQYWASPNYWIADTSLVRLLVWYSFYVTTWIYEFVLRVVNAGGDHIFETAFSFKVQILQVGLYARVAMAQRF